MKKQRCDCTTMPKTVTPESQKSGFWRKPCGTWSAIGSKVRQFILHLRLWRWAAVHSRNFNYFEISFTKMIDCKIYRSPYDERLFFVNATVREPDFYYVVPMGTVEIFCKKHNLSIVQLCQKL